MLFDKNLEIIGKHAEYIRKLTDNIDSKNSIFSAAYVVYKTASIIGFIYNRKSKKDSSPAKSLTIFLDQLRKVRDDLEFNYRLIMLLDKNHESNFDERLQKAFNYYGSDQAKVDEELFEQYSLGGIEVLYEKLMKDVNKPDDCLSNIFCLIQEFNSGNDAENISSNLIELSRKMQST
jgi:hypothetical protein